MKSVLLGSSIEISTLHCNEQLCYDTMFSNARSDLKMGKK